MHKAILMILLAVVCSSVMAEFIHVNKSSNYTFYADPNTIRKSDNKVKMWDLNDYKMPEKIGGKETMSTRSQREYNCEEEKSRMLYGTFHSKNMGRGEIVLTINKTTEWEPVIPDSTGESLLKYACSADAEWRPVTRVQDEDAIVYADATTIHKTGNRIKAWLLYDYKTAKEINGKQFMSMKTHSEHDCKKEQVRLLYNTYHSKDMGRGEIVFTDPHTSRWVPAENGSVRRVLWKTVCGK